MENAVGPGTPDVNGHYKDKDFWLELKIDDTPLRTDQRIWLLRRHRAGGVALVLQYETKLELFRLYVCLPTGERSIYFTECPYELFAFIMAFDPNSVVV